MTPGIPFGRAEKVHARPGRDVEKKASPQRLRAIWPDVKELIRPRRNQLLLGLGLIVVSRVAGLVLPASTKMLVDDVVGKHKTELLNPLILAVTCATAVQAATTFWLTQLLSKSAQRLIAEMRCSVQRHVGRLPITYFDANKTGALVSRIMNDVEGVRNLVGTGLVEFVGGLLTAMLSLVDPVPHQPEDDVDGAGHRAGIRVHSAEGVSIAAAASSASAARSRPRSLGV